MADLIRPRQRAVTAVAPHNGNDAYIVPSRLKEAPANGGLQPIPSDGVGYNQLLNAWAGATVATPIDFTAGNIGEEFEFRATVQRPILGGRSTIWTAANGAYLSFSAASNVGVQDASTPPFFVFASLPATAFDLYITGFKQAAFPEIQCRCFVDNVESVSGVLGFAEVFFIPQTFGAARDANFQGVAYFNLQTRRPGSGLTSKYLIDEGPGNSASVDSLGNEDNLVMAGVEDTDWEWLP